MKSTQKSRLSLPARFISSLFLLLFLLAPLFAETREETIRKASDLLRNGRFKEAEESFRRLIEADPKLPDGYFFISFSQFIHLIYNPTNKKHVSELEKNLVQSIALGEERVKTVRDGAEARLLLGTSYLLESYYRAMKKEAFSAAFLAKKGKKILENLSETDPAYDDALFGLGIYNYYADRVPSIVKGIRFLLFLPGGDHAKGIQQLRKASSSARYFSMESSLMLAEIYSNKFERDHYSAYRELSSVADAEQGPLLILHALARLYMKVLNPGRAAELLAQAIIRAEAERSDRDVVGLMRFHLAKCYLSLGRAEQALPPLRNLLTQNAIPSHREEVLLLAATALLLSGRSDEMEEFRKSVPGISKILDDERWKKDFPKRRLSIYRRNMEALEKESGGEREEALRILKDMIEEDETNLWSRLRLGELYLRNEKPREAFQLFQQILVSADDSSREIKDLAELRAANSQDLMGDRRLAEEYYRRIIARGSSLSREAAFLYLKMPFGKDFY